MPTRDHPPDDRRRLARRPAHLRRRDRDRRRHPRARGARLGPLRPVTPDRMPVGRSRRDGRRRSAGRRSAATRRARSTPASLGRASTSRPTRAGGASAGPCSRPSSRPRRLPATGPCSRASWPRTPRAWRSTSGSASGGSASRSGWARTQRGRWRDVVLLERRSPIVGARLNVCHTDHRHGGYPRPPRSRHPEVDGGSRPRRAGPSGRS